MPPNPSCFQDDSVYLSRQTKIVCDLLCVGLQTTLQKTVHIGPQGTQGKWNLTCGISRAFMMAEKE